MIQSKLERDVSAFRPRNVATIHLACKYGDGALAGGYAFGTGLILWFTSLFGGKHPKLRQHLSSVVNILNFANTCLWDFFDHCGLISHNDATKPLSPLLSSSIPYLSACYRQCRLSYGHIPTLHPTPSWNPLNLTWFNSNTTLGLQLEVHHVDALSSEETLERLFDLRLQRDALRVETICSQVGTSPKQPLVNIHARRPEDVLGSVALLFPGSLKVVESTSRASVSELLLDPIFNPTKSRSFSGIPCGSPLCRSLDSSGWDAWRWDVVTPISGCSSVLRFVRPWPGRLSFPTQTGRRLNRKFSYCLVDRSASSKPSSMVFGDAAIPRTAVFTPLLTKPKLDTFYFVQLLGISVGKTSVKVPTVVLNFRGADVSLPVTNYLIPVDSRRTFCGYHEWFIINWKYPAARFPGCLRFSRFPDRVRAQCMRLKK
ncbi:hypothetical protein F3Y22_tig00110467pilonHSYRG00196 [Hibiscus syriacus]|uniref:Uncharacterized protein n=1 Tax=Hibiscus syriacus TaxID=106335 RepID=A0A6A3AHQ6_HIBSY|nr:hypothetical protein F3Y22_tig00110467pilonHSYRG00196 [Hibiscus syriacus]